MCIHSLSFQRIFLLSAFACCAGTVEAQVGEDLPAAVIPGSCKSIDFNRATLSKPVRLDIVVRIDESGRVLSAAPLEDVSNAALTSAVLASVMTCRFEPAKRGGQATASVARQLYQFPAAAAAQPLLRKAAITDVVGCAPKNEDYPAASRQLNETGTTRVTFTVNPQGLLTAFGVSRSSGYLRLDFTALIKLAGCKFQPATAADGTPTSSTFEVEYVWKLE